MPIFIGYSSVSLPELEKMRILWSRTLSPLTTNAIFLSDLSQTFTSDSSNLKNKKMFLHNVFFSGHQDIRIFCFFLFLNVWTYFSSDFKKIAELIALRARNSNRLKNLR